MLEDDRKPAVWFEKAETHSDAFSELGFVMTLREAALAPDDGFRAPSLIPHVEPEPMVPQDRKIQIRDESAVGRIGEDVVHCARLDETLQCGGVRGPDMKIVATIDRVHAFGLGAIVIPEVQDFLFGFHDVLESSSESLPDRKLRALRSQLV